MIRMRRGVAAGVVSCCCWGSACSGGDELDLSPPSDATASPNDTDDTDASSASEAIPTSCGRDVPRRPGGRAHARRARRRQGGADEIGTLSAGDEVSGRVICLVVQQVGDWVDVYLPSGPGGSIGWVGRDDVTLSRHQFRIEVDRAAQRSPSTPARRCR